jgi:valyl-tRNA synthetase
MSNHQDQSYSVPPRVFFIPETHPLFNLYRIELSNERFVAGAPAQVLDMERKKQADAEAKIKALEASLAQLG